MATILGKSSSNASDTSLAELRQRLDLSKMPAHIAIIMDGNGRWARSKHLPSRLFGHREGYKTVKNIVRFAVDLDIQVLTLYVFSNENWSRPKHETDGLMTLYEHATRAELPELLDNGVQMRFIGRRDGLSSSLIAEMERATAATKKNTKLVLNLALNYGGRSEIVDAARKAAQSVLDGTISAEAIDETYMSQQMYAHDLPDPDLLIRTAGEMRVSNFLLWGIAYSEIWVTETLWPDFSSSELVDGIQAYQSRVRKFGGVLTP